MFLFDKYVEWLLSHLFGHDKFMELTLYESENIALFSYAYLEFKNYAKEKY